MIKTVAIYKECDMVQVMQFEVSTADLDLKQAIHDAAFDYAKTIAGWKEVCSREGFNLNTFFKCVPDIICKKYGFAKIGNQKVSEHWDGGSQLLTAQDMRFCKEYQQTVSSRNYQVSEITAYFARMWGVMETLGTLPQKDFRETTGDLIAWAEEFVRTGEKDLLVFFENKTKDIR